MTAVAFSEDKDHPFRELVTSNDKSIGRNLLQRGYGRGCGCECERDCDCEKTKKKRKRQRRKRQAWKYVPEMNTDYIGEVIIGTGQPTVGECKAECLSINDCKYIYMRFAAGAELEPADSAQTLQCWVYRSGSDYWGPAHATEDSRFLERLQ